MYFPIFIDLTGKRVLVVGAGMVAARRIRVLREFAGQITVLAPQICPQIWEQRQEARSDCRKDLPRGGDSAPCVIEIRQKKFCGSDLTDFDLVLAATDDAALNREIAALCKSRGIPVNVASEQALCDFQFPSIIKEENLVIAVNASGQDHRLVKETRKRIEQCLYKGRCPSLYKEEGEPKEEPQ